MNTAHACDRMSLKWFLLSVSATIILGSPLALAEPVAQTDPAWQQAVEQVIERYIRAHPEVIEQAFQDLQTIRHEQERLRVKAVIASRQNDLLGDPVSPVSGNLNGDVTVVEFFDYRCGFCKQTAGAVTQLQKDDPRVRIIYKDFPILGEESELAAKAALASQSQGKHQSFHEALLASQEEITLEEILRIAAEVGLDTNKLEGDMADLKWQTVIDRNRALAQDLGITGTPGFIVGTELVRGALGLEELKALVARGGE